MKIDKFELFMNVLICGLIACSPLIGTYYGIKWIVTQIYNHTPKRKKAIQEQIQEIHRLEEQLGFHYDPYYYKNSEHDNKTYLEDLREKAQSNYKAPDIIIGIEELDVYGLGLPPTYNGNCYVMLLIDKDYYDIPTKRNEDNKTFVRIIFNTQTMSHRADVYFEFWNYLYSHTTSTIAKEGGLHTLSECGKYENYYVVPIPGVFRRDEVVTGNNRVEKFIDDFRKKYKKQTEHNSDECIRHES